MSVSVPPGWREELRAGAWSCHYCFAVATSFDHIVPTCLGGSDYPWNLVPACEQCNLRKADTMPCCCCRRCWRAVNQWRRRLPEDRRRQLVDSLTARIQALVEQREGLVSAPRRGPGSR